MMVLAGWLGVSVGFVLGAVWSWAVRGPRRSEPATDRWPASIPTAIAARRGVAVRIAMH
jgi:hypothetical protein